MKQTFIALAAISAALTFGAASAQTSMTPADAASAPKTRAEVKAETRAAMKDGSLSRGDAGATKARPHGGPETKTSKTAGKTRAEVKAETRAAMKDGNLSQGDAGYTKMRPEGGPATKTDSAAGNSRADVKAETKAALAARELPVSERQMPLPTDTKKQ